MINYVSLLGLVIIFSTVKCEDCFKLDISLSQKVENEGFHRDIRWLMELHNINATKWLTSQCKIALYLDVNAGMFVNKDEIADLNQFRDVLVKVIGDVNIETPAHESTAHIAYVYLPISASDTIVFNLPIHLRYQRSQITGKFGKVHLKRPTLLVNCQDKVVLCGKRRPIVEAPCNASVEEQCKWRNVTYQALFEDVEMFVPIGDLDDYPIVSVVTLLLGCAGCIYILSLLSTAPI